MLGAMTLPQFSPQPDDDDDFVCGPEHTPLDDTQAVHIEPAGVGLPKDEYLAGLLDGVAAPHVARGAAAEDVHYLRRSIYAFLVSPSSETWERAHSLIILDYHQQRSLTLWRLVLEVTSFTYGVHAQGSPWPVVPTPSKVLVALATVCAPPMSVDMLTDPDQDIYF